MSLSESLSQFLFDLETSDLLTSLGRSQKELNQELGELGMSGQLVDLMTNHRRVLNSVLLRLRLLSESNKQEDQVRSSLSRLNNNLVTSLLDHLYSQNQDSSQSEHKDMPQSEQHQTTPQSDEQVDEQVDDNSDEEDESILLNSFFTECVKQTDDSADVVRSKDFYTALNNWWVNESSSDIPTKTTLKTYLTERLGKGMKGTWTNVALN